MRHAESELLQKIETDQSGENVNQDADRVCDEDIAHCGIGTAIVRENRKALDECSYNVCRKQQQRLAQAIPVVKPPTAAMHSKLGIFVAKNRRLVRPERMRRLQAVHSIC